MQILSYAERNFFLALLVFFPSFFGSCQKKEVNPAPDPDLPPVVAFTDTLRFATYNVSMFRNQAGQLQNELANPFNVQVQRVAAVIQEVRPDVLALMEFDFDPGGIALRRFIENFLHVSQNGKDSVHFAYAYPIASNTGILSGADLNRDGNVQLPEDAFGFGNFEGQYAFALLSRFPLDTAALLSFQNLLWKNMPNALLPENADGSAYYSPEALNVFRVSSKNHVDLPILLPNKQSIHVVLAHPTPPVFDGPEDRNGRRNHDEIRLIADYLSNASYLESDKGEKGGLDSNAFFVVMGDLNADPNDGDGVPNAIRQLLQHPLVHQDVTFGNKVPKSAGGAAHNKNPNDQGDPAYDTSFFGLRADYVLPSANFKVVDTGVFWPAPADPLHILIANGSASDHLLVWVDVALN